MLDPETKLRLLIHGIRTNLKPLRSGGAGPTGGLGFKVKGSVVSTPVVHEFAKNSPFWLKESGNGYILYENEKKIGGITLPKAEYYSESVDGIPAGKLVALDGYDALVSAISRRCIYWDYGKKCSFCSIQNGIKNSIARKNPEQLAQAVKLAYEEDRSRHLTLTTGTLEGGDKGARAVADAVKAVKREISIDVHVQVEPVDREWIEKLYESGADTIGIHVETFDRTIRDTVVPGKPSLQKYLRAWKDAVDVFGEWNVSSWLIIGLGEKVESVMQGFETMANMTVYPFIAPFRPSNGMEHNQNLEKHFFQILKDLKDTFNLSRDDLPEFGSGCPKCNGCSFVSELVSR